MGRVDLVYNSFAGAFSDSPRAVFERLRAEPGHRHVWLAAERHAAAFPPGVETVPYGSPEAVLALEAADVVVANTHTDFEWSKGPRTLYLQIWHGSPLKRVHRDILWSPPGLLDRLQRDVDRWDVLVSPNEASTAAPAPGVPLGRRGARDRLSPQRRAQRAGPRRTARARARAARDRRRHDRGPLHADLPRRRGVRRAVVRARPRQRRVHRRARGRSRPAAAPALHGHRGAPARRPRRRARRLPAPRRQRALPRRRRARHRLLVDDVRLRGHRPAAGVPDLRPRRLPAPPARLLLRPRRARRPGRWSRRPPS